MLTEMAIAGAVMAGLGIGLSSVLAVANKRFYVYEDPRIDEVEDMLPAANCGACGCAGCRAFAEALVNGEIVPGRCTVNSTEMVEAIASFLGVDAGLEERKVARLACAGGKHVSQIRAQYRGIQSCRAASLVGGGGKGCAWGCLGFGDCKVSCKFDAITMTPQGLPIVHEDPCTACGACVEACPRELYSLHPIRHRLWVACKNEAQGEVAEEYCEVACTACGRCAMDAAPGVIAIANDLATIDYDKNDRAAMDAILRCPTGAIVWFEEGKGAVKGPAAKKVLRKTPLPVG